MFSLVQIKALNARAGAGVCLVLDEFPYLVQASPELPSLVQKWVDDRDCKIHLMLCGSSQRMMQGLVLDESEPLYGRAREIIKIPPLEPAWIRDALGLGWIESVEAYAVWGGVPRYWELARDFASFEEGVKDLVGGTLSVDVCTEEAPPNRHVRAIREQQIRLAGQREPVQCECLFPVVEGRISRSARRSQSSTF